MSYLYTLWYVVMSHRGPEECSTAYGKHMKVPQKVLGIYKKKS